MNNEFLKLKNYKKFFLLKEEEYDFRRDMRGMDPNRESLSLGPRPSETHEVFQFWVVPTDKEPIAKSFGLKQLKDTNKWGFTFNSFKKHPGGDLVKYLNAIKPQLGNNSDTMWVEPTQDLK